MPDTTITLGADTGATETKGGALVHGAWVPDSQLGLASRTADGPDVTIQRNVELCTKVLAKIGGTWDQVNAVGADIPCPTAGGEALDPSNMGDERWKGFPFRAELSKAIAQAAGRAVPVMVINDGDAGLLGELDNLSPDVGDGRVGGLFVGSGVGGGYAVNREIIENASGSAEPGATMIHADESMLGLGFSWRRLEHFVSLFAIKRQLTELDQLSGGDGSRSEQDFLEEAKQVLPEASAALAAGDHEHQSLKIMQFQAQTLGAYIQVLLQWTRLDAMIVGGGIVDPRRVSAEFVDWLIEQITEKAKASITAEARRKVGFPVIQAARSGDWAAPKGAAFAASLGR
jgi:glucokinase